MDWRDIAGNWILVPRNPKAVIHFLGGAFLATAPQLSYRSLLEGLGERGYVVVATPFLNTFDHTDIARQTARAFIQCLDYLKERVFRQQYFPVYGVGHSMGCKIHLLIGSLFPQERAGNIFLAFNNYPARRSIPFLEQFTQFAPDLTLEFTPSPEDTNAIIERHYQVQRNLLIKFKDDDIDQTRSLSEVILRRFPDMTTIQILPGNHLTPVSQTMKWQSGQVFTPFDAIGQFVNQELSRDLNRLKKDMLLWLDPLAYR